MPEPIQHLQHRSPEAEVPPYADLDLPPHLIAVGPWLGPGEASALASRGQLTAVGPLFCTLPVPGAVERAWALSTLLRPRTRAVGVVCRLSAAWIHGCAAHQPWVEVARHRRRTLSLGAEEDLRVRRRFVHYAPGETVSLGPLAVTSPLRTAADLALHGTGARERTALYSLLHAPGLLCSPEAVCAVVRALPRVPHPERAVARIQSLAEAGRAPVMR